VYRRLGGTKGNCKSMEFYPNFFYGKDNENHKIGIGFFVHPRIVSAVKRVESFRDSTSYVAHRGHCLHVISLYYEGNCLTS
jgi:hypothetical protein